MMFPSAVNGQMPFADVYKQEQIKKVIEKHRSRHHSGPDSRSGGDKSNKHKDAHSMPILWQSVYSGNKPNFRSMPALDNSRLALHTSSRHHRPCDQNKSHHKHSLLSSLKKLFSKKDDSSKHASSGAIVQGNCGRAYSAPSKKVADGDIVVMSGGCSPKRQRMRTISNLSNVMETIEEVSEVLASTDHLGDDSDTCSSSCSLETYRSYTSAPELVSTTNLTYSCSSNFSDSQSSHHGSSSEVICAV